MTGPGSPPTDGEKRYLRELVRGAGVNVLGLVAKLIYPLFFVVVAWLFGPAILGVYLLTTFIGEIAAKLVSSGYADATTIYGSHHADAAKAGDEGASARLYDVLANAYLVTGAMSALVIGAALLGAGPLVAALYPAHPEVVEALWIFSAAIPFLAFAEVSIAATKAYMRMEYAAGIHGFANPFGLLVFSVVAWWLDGGLLGLMWAILASQVLTATLAAWAVSRHFRWSRVVRALIRPSLDGVMARFAWPQSLNMTFAQYATRIDVLMLGAAGFHAEDLAFYGTAALVTSQLRVLKTVFGTAFAPVIARHHEASEAEALEALLGRVSRWTTTLIGPVVLAVVVLRYDILRFVDETFIEDSLFMVVLLAVPYMSCAGGLASNGVTFTGHSNWTLANAIGYAALNTTLNLLLIPPYGLLGAAIATAISAICLTSAAMIELRVLEGVTVRWRYVYKPNLGLLLGAGALAFVWDPVDLPNLGVRLAVAAGVIVLYLVAMQVLGHEEIAGFTRSRLGRAR